MALRTGSPIFAEESLLDLVKVEIAEGEETTPQAPEPFKSTGSSAPGKLKAPEPPLREGGMSPSELQEYLRKLNPEDFGRFNP